MSKIADNILSILGECRVEGDTLFLPDRQLDRSTYQAVNKVLVNIGGKWDRRAKGHVFLRARTDILLIGKPGIAKMHVNIYQSGNYVLTFQVNHFHIFLLPRIRSLRQNTRDFSVFYQNIPMSFRTRCRIDQITVL